MNTKLQELSNKLYAEGIEKAQTDADSIIQKAKQDAKAILEEAASKKEAILIETQNEVNRFRKNVNSELRMASKQMLASLKQQITELVQEKVIEKPISEGLKNPENLLSLLQTVVSKMNQGSSGIEIKLSEVDHNNISEAIKAGKSSVLSEGITLSIDSSVQSGFKLQSNGSNYLISFTDEDFFRFFSHYMREQTVKFLEPSEND